MINKKNTDKLRLEFAMDQMRKAKQIISQGLVSDGMNVLTNCIHTIEESKKK